MIVLLTGAFFCMNMVLITLSSFVSVTVINLYMRRDQKNEVPDWLRKVRARHHQATLLAVAPYVHTHITNGCCC